MPTIISFTFLFLLSLNLNFFFDNFPINEPTAIDIKIKKIIIAKPIKLIHLICKYSIVVYVIIRTGAIIT